MDFGALIKESWTTTWRHRYLWLLGVFAGGTAGGIGGGGNGSSRWSQGRNDGRYVPADLPAAAEQVTAWTVANAGWLIAAVVTGVLVGVALLIIGLIAQGGMAEATVDLAQGRETSLRRAWRTGLRLFWRYAGLWLTLALAALTIALLVGAIVAAIAGAGFVGSQLSAGGNAAVAVAVVVGFLIGLPLLIALVLGAISLSIVVAYAQRAIYADDAGPVTALGIGWRTLRAHVGQSLLTWLVSVGLGIAAGISGAFLLLPFAAVFGGLGYAAFAADGIGAPLISIAALGVIALLFGGALFTGIVNTFFWNYWTRAYLRLHI